jgi:glutaredoxin
MPEAEKSDKKWSKQATEKLFAALNRADEIGGEIRDYLQDRVATDPRYVQARKRLAKLLGREYESRTEVAQAAQVRAEKTAAAAATTTKTAPVKNKGFGDASIKAQIYGKKSCPWTGRAITLLERNKVDFDYVDLEEPEHEAKLTPLTQETKQHTVPFIYLRGQFVGGFNALSEIDRLGQLDAAMMSADERAKAPPHQRNVVVTPRPNTDEIAPAELDPAE